MSLRGSAETGLVGDGNGHCQPEMRKVARQPLNGVALGGLVSL